MPEWSGAEWAKLLAEAARTMATQESLASTAGEIALLAVTVVPGAEAAGISLTGDGTVSTLGATDDLARAIDSAQQELAEGPCLDAAWADRILLIDDVSDEPRWPRFVQRAKELGVGSLLACHLSSEHGLRTALNLYAAAPKAFDELAVGIGQIFATHATIALQSARLEADLRAAVESRQGIGEAVGILMERHHLTPKQGFDLLVRTSQLLNRKVRDLADVIVLTGVDPVSTSELARLAASQARHRAEELRRHLLERPDRPQGSSPAHLEAALLRAKAADARAAASLQRAVDAKLAAAAAHDRAAAFHEAKADAGRADAVAHEDQAKFHRDAASRARDAARLEAEGPH